MAVTLRKAFIDPWASKPVHESVLHARRMASGKRLSWDDRNQIRDNYLPGLSDVLRIPSPPKQYGWDYDDVYGSWGVWDRVERTFVAHAGSETGARIMARKLNQEGK